MTSKNHGKLFNTKNKKAQAFTIVELLVVIVVIGILAALSIVSYTGIRERAIAARLISDLNNDAKLLEFYKVEHSVYPDTLDGSNCPNAPTADSRYCLVVSEKDDTLTYDGGGEDYTLTITDDDSDISYKITSGGSPVAVTSGSESTLPSSFMYTWGGSYYDQPSSVAKSSDGSYVIVGNSSSYGTSTNGSNGIITKFKLNGTDEWSYVFETEGATNFDSVIQTSDGGYAISGSVTDGDGNTEAYIAKLTSAGVISWDKTWGGDDYDEARSIIQSSDGGYVVVGSHYVYDEVNETSDNDAFIIKLTSNGGLSWEKTWGGDYDESAGSVVQTSDSGYAITGTTSSFGDENGDAFIAKFTSDGVLSWDKTWGGGGYDESLSIIGDYNEFFVITGVTYSFNDASNGDAFIAQFSSSGSFVRDKTWGGSYNDTGLSIIETSEGYAVSGQATRNSAESVSSITKFFTGGDIDWQRVWLLGENSYVLQNADNSYSFVGKTNHEDGAGEYDISVAKYDVSGDIDGCSAVCSTVSYSPDDISASVSSTSATVSSPSATMLSPSVTQSSINPTISPIDLSGAL